MRVSREHQAVDVQEGIPQGFAVTTKKLIFVISLMNHLLFL